MPDMILLETEEKMDKAISSFEYELNTIRTGRANASLLDSISVEYYGAMTPLRQVASISIPEPTQLYIKPYDKSLFKAIENAISTSSIGINPQSDANGIRLILPKMTEDRRRELVKQVGKLEEQAKVMVRNARRDGNDAIKKLGLPEDEEKGYLDEIQELTDKKIASVERIAKAKSDDLMSF